MKILIADRDWIIRESISRLASEIVPTAAIFTARNGEELDLIVVANPDLAIAIIDDSIIDGGEEALFARLRSRAPRAAIGVLALSIDRERVLKAVYFGAVAIILKTDNRDQIARALSLLISGEVALPRHLLERGPARPETAPASVRERRVEEDRLTPREREVIGLIGKGQSVARIAADLKLSPHTVRVHVTRIMKKLDLRDRPSLTRYAVIRIHAGGRVDDTVTH